MSHHDSQSGFTVIELLITLFVAVAFVVSGYQLYNVIIKDGGQTRGESRASNLAYDYLRRYTSSATDPCTISTPVNGATPTVAGIGAVSVSVNISCPYANNNSVSKVEAVVTYNTNPQETIKYATYTTGVGYDGTGVSPVGLVGWWKFNGNASDSSPSGANGTVSGATLTTGQNGQANSAYNFNGTNNYINAQVPVVAGDYAHTISLWVYPRSLTGPAARVDPFSLGNAAANTYSALDLTTTMTQWYFYSNDIFALQPVAINQWTLITLTYTGGGGTTANKKIYINSTPYSTTTSGTIGPINLPASSPVGIGYDRGRATAYFDGLIDDVRIYSRVLSPLEISNLYADGAQ